MRRQENRIGFFLRDGVLTLKANQEIFSLNVSGYKKLFYNMGEEVQPTNRICRVVRPERKAVESQIA